MSFDSLKAAIKAAAPARTQQAEPLIVVAICGKARAGKDTAAQVLVSHGGFLRVALADGLKSLLNDLDGPTWDFRKERDEAGKTDRWAAQQAGTECREAIGDPYHWVNHLAIKLQYASKVHPSPRTRFVVPDLRYPFEETRLREIVTMLGGRLEVWRVVRPGQEMIEESAHASETSGDSIPIDCVFENTASLADFAEMVATQIPSLLKQAGPAHEAGQCADCDSPFACGIKDECLGPMKSFWDALEYIKFAARPEPARTPHRIPRLNDPRDGSAPPPVLYLSGPMTGIEGFNFPAFNNAAEKLRRKGFPVLNPADFGWGEPDWARNLSRDLTMLGYSDILVQLPGWELSKGATLESNTAASLGKGVVSLAEVLDLP